MKRRPERAGRDGNPRRRLEIAAGETRLNGLSSCYCSFPVPIGLTADARRPVSPRRTAESVGLVGCPNTGSIACERATECTVPSTECTVPSTECTVSSHLAWGCDKRPELGTEAAEILISPSGGVPAARGEAAATSERSERERVAVRSRGGRGVRLTGGIGR